MRLIFVVALLTELADFRPPPTFTRVFVLLDFWCNGVVFFVVVLFLLVDLPLVLLVVGEDFFTEAFLLPDPVFDFELELLLPFEHCFIVNATSALTQVPLCEISTSLTDALVSINLYVTSFFFAT